MSDWNTHPSGQSSQYGYSHQPSGSAPPYQSFPGPDPRGYPNQAGYYPAPPHAAPAHMNPGSGNQYAPPAGSPPGFQRQSQGQIRGMSQFSSQAEKKAMLYQLAGEVLGTVDDGHGGRKPNWRGGVALDQRSSQQSSNAQTMRNTKNGNLDSWGLGDMGIDDGLGMGSGVSGGMGGSMGLGDDDTMGLGGGGRGGGGGGGGWKQSLGLDSGTNSGSRGGWRQQLGLGGRDDDNLGLGKISKEDKEALEAVQDVMDAHDIADAVQSIQDGGDQGEAVSQIIQALAS